MKSKRKPAEMLWADQPAPPGQIARGLAALRKLGQKRLAEQAAKERHKRG